MAGARYDDRMGSLLAQAEGPYVDGDQDPLRAFSQDTASTATPSMMREVFIGAHVAATVICVVAMLVFGVAWTMMLMVTMLHTLLMRRYLRRMAAAQRGATPRETFLKKAIWLHRIEHLDSTGYPAPTRWRISQLLRQEWLQLIRALRGPQGGVEAAEASRRAAE